MKLFKSEGWKSFWPNFLAVILGIVITFGGERFISNYQKRQDAREIVALFKTDALSHLEISEGLIADFMSEMSALRHCAAAHNRKEWDKVPEDTLRCALSFFFSVRGDTYSPVGMKMLDISGALGAVREPEVVESVSRISNIITAFWKQSDKMFANISSAKQHLYESGRLDWFYRGASPRETLVYRFHCLMDDTLCSGLITRGSVPTYLRMFRDMNKSIRAELEDLAAVGY